MPREQMLCLKWYQGKGTIKKPEFTIRCIHVKHTGGIYHEYANERTHKEGITRH